MTHKLLFIFFLVKITFGCYKGAVMSLFCALIIEAIKVDLASYKDFGSSSQAFTIDIAVREWISYTQICLSLCPHITG